MCFSINKAMKEGDVCQIRQYQHPFSCYTRSCSHLKKEDNALCFVQWTIIGVWHVDEIRRRLFLQSSQGVNTQVQFDALNTILFFKKPCKVKFMLFRNYLPHFLGNSRHGAGSILRSAFEIAIRIYRVVLSTHSSPNIISCEFIIVRLHVF
jgi:hypothetical protein